MCISLATQSQEGLQSTKDKWGILEPSGDGLHSIAGTSDEKVPLQRIKSQLSSLPCYRAVLDQTVSLPPHSESLVPARIEGLQSTKDKWGILEPSGDGLHSIAGTSDEKVPLQRIKSQLSSLPCYRAVLDQTVSLPPHSESLVPARIEGLQSTKDKWGILEPSGDGLHGIAGIMAGRTLVDLEQPTVQLPCTEPVTKGANWNSRARAIWIQLDSSNY